MAMATIRNARAQLICVFRGWASRGCATPDLALCGLLTDFSSTFFFDFELIGSGLHFLLRKPVENLSVPFGQNQLLACVLLVFQQSPSRELLFGRFMIE